MKGTRKYLMLPIAVAATAVMAACGGGSSGTLATVGGPTIAPYTPTATKSSTSTSSTSTQRPTFSSDPTTAETMVPRGCVQDGWNTADWNTAPDESGRFNPSMVGDIFNVSLSTGDCFDTIVFNIDTISDTQFTAQYVDVVTADGSGAPVTDIAGNAFLQLSIKAPVPHDDQGNLRYPDVHYNVKDPAGFKALRELRLVTIDYEGYSTFGIGVNAKTPFAVESTVSGSSGTGKVIVRIAHDDN